MIYLAAVLGALVLAGIVYQKMGSARDARLFPPPGKLVDVGGYRLHIHCAGSGKPAVVFESGVAASSVSWELVRPAVAEFTQVCTYDRAGLGWSEPAPSPRTLENVMRELKTLLSKAEVPASWILVGHSFGGMVALEYALSNPAEIAGLVLVDPLAAKEWCPPVKEEARRLWGGVRLSRRGAWLASIGVVRFSLNLLRGGARRIPQMIVEASATSAGSDLTRRLVTQLQKLPPEALPIIQAHWSQPKSFRSMSDYLEALPSNAASCTPLQDLGDLPLIVLSAEDASPVRSEEHNKIARLSSRGELIIAKRSGHWIQLDRPDLVIDAIRRLTT